MNTQKSSCKKESCNWQSLSDNVETLITNYIRDNNLKPGDIMPKEEELASMFNVSRRVVREAISRLRATGLLIAKRRLGTLVNKTDVFKVLQKTLSTAFLTGGEKQDLLTLRFVLEQGLPELLFRNLDEKIIAELDAIVKREEADPADREEYLRCDYLFHMKIYEATKCQTLLAFQGLLSEFFVSERNQPPPVPEFANRFNDDSQISHRDLLNVIISRDVQAFRQLNSRHLERYF